MLKEPSIRKQLGGSNRTIVGLKVLKEPSIRKQLGVQQSHHCGIERCSLLDDGVNSSTSSNRTIVGLKGDRDLLADQCQLGSNRTIVGLKELRSEMKAYTQFAAIAPLWD